MVLILIKEGVKIKLALSFFIMELNPVIYVLIECDTKGTQSFDLRRAKIDAKKLYRPCSMVIKHA